MSADSETKNSDNQPKYHVIHGIPGAPDRSPSPEFKMLRAQFMGEAFSFAQELSAVSGLP